MKALLIFSMVLLSTFKLEVSGEYVPKDQEKAYSTAYRLHKCSCPGNQILVDNVCKEYNTTILTLIEEFSFVTQEVETRYIDHTLVQPLACPLNYLNLTLPGDLFALKSSGNLLNTNYGLNLDFSMYCVEHSLNENEELIMEVHLCLPIPLVPKCCQNDSANQCSLEDNNDLAINFVVGKILSQMKTKSFPNALKCTENENLISVPIDSDNSIAHMKLTNEGLILSHQVSILGHTVNIPSPEYCVDTMSERKETEASFASYCPVDLLSLQLKNCEGITCVRKCCPFGELFDKVNYRCVRVARQSQWNPIFFDTETHNEVTEAPKYKLITGFPLNCEVFDISPRNDPPDNFQLLTNGSLYVTNWAMSLPAEGYCLDNFRYETDTYQEAMVCFLENPQPKHQCKHVNTQLYPAMLIISCIFLGITLIVYAIIPDLHSKIQGKCLISSIIALLCAYICLTIVQMSSSIISPSTCVVFGLLVQFTFLASFFWLNVMSFDIWKTLRSLKSGRESPAGARRRFILYSLYAWGCPFIISIVTIIMQYLPSSVDKTHLILPRIGETDCIFPKTDKTVYWVYFYSYISIILVVNTIFFLHLAVILIKAKKFSENTLGKKTQLHKEWAKLYLKLFLIMGITWIFEVTAFIEGSCSFWIVTDVANCLRGLLIFVVFVCKRDVIKKLMTESSPAFHRMRITVRQSSSLFSRSSKRTSNMYIDPTTTDASHEPTNNRNHADVNL